MKRISILLCALAAILSLPILTAYAQTLLNQYQPGFRLINGSQLNLMVNAVNNIQGKGTPGAVTASTLTASGAFTLTSTTAASACLINATYASGGTSIANADLAFYVATRAVRVLAISQVHAVAAGGASVVQVTKDTTTNAPGAGTDLLTNNTNTGFDLNATANTVQNGTLAATAGLTSLAAGDRLSLDFAQAVQSSVGIVVSVCMAPL